MGSNASPVPNHTIALMIMPSLLTAATARRAEIHRPYNWPLARWNWATDACDRRHRKRTCRTVPFRLRRAFAAAPARTSGVESRNTGPGGRRSS